MKVDSGWRFDPRSLAWAMAFFIALLLLGTVGAHAGWWRSFFGDVLAVVWLYFVFATVVSARPVVLALTAFAVGCGLEGMQYLAALMHWHIPNRALRILLGSTPDWMDVLAYGLGAAAALCIEALRAPRAGFAQGALE